jgi:hypothetical protein
MAVLPPIKRFVLDDFAGIKDVSAFASKLFYPLNRFLNAVYSGLNNGLTLNQNTIGLVTTQTSVSSNSSGVATTTLNWTYPQSPPLGVVVMACNQSSISMPFPIVTWGYNAGVVSIQMQFVQVTSGALVTAPAGTYAVTFWVSGG